MPEKNPAVSVLMPVYNAEQYVAQAVQSVLDQTFTDFELVLVNDGSTDRSVAIVEQYTDPRIRLIHNESNMGLARVRNRLLEFATAPYIAWLDSDDYSVPERLRLQFDFLETHPDVALCGGFAQPFHSASGRRQKVWKYPTDAEETRVRLLFDDPLATSTVMVRTALFREHNIQFRLEFPPAEDYDVWERIAQHGKIVNLGRVLTYYRIHANQSSTAGKEREVESVRTIQRRQLDRTGISASDAELKLHLAFGMNRYEPSPEFRAASEAWLTRLLTHNDQTGYYERAAFRNVIADRWYRVCYAGWRAGMPAYRDYDKSPLAKLTDTKQPNRRSFWTRSLAASFRAFMMKPGPWSDKV